jgi:pantoate--beta-alanine ligase
VRTLRTPDELRAFLHNVREERRTVGLVPSMGAFHAGHEALITAAREACDVVVVSLFVNPTQFDDPTDLAAYPRTEADDAARAQELGADVLFAPETLYADDHATTITVAGLGDTLEGSERGPGHFAGVCTVVAKLFNLVGPDTAYFGAKDAQQVAVIKRMVRDLDMPVRIEVVDTVREPDGLALSSRNVRLAAGAREQALALHAALTAAEQAVEQGERNAVRVRDAALAAMRDYDVDPEYLAVVDPDSLSPLQTLNGRSLVAVAARVGGVRLIDNTLITTPGDSS